jgi:hypothetical protein
MGRGTSVADDDAPRGPSADPDPVEAELAAVSAALDDEGPWPDALSADAAAFRTGALVLRGALRIEAAEAPPDVLAAVRARIAAEDAAGGAGEDVAGDAAGDAGAAADAVPVAALAARRRPPRGAWLWGAAAAFATGVLVAALVLGGRSPGRVEVAGADVVDDVVRAQRSVDELVADVTIVEHGVGPDLPVRRSTGTLVYEAPERLWLQLHDATGAPRGWPANDVEVVVDDDIAWRRGLLACPVDRQPGCLVGPVTQAITQRAPFSAGAAAPLDLVVPVGGLVPRTGVVDATVVDDTVVVRTDVAHLRGLVDGLLGTGAFRAVHPTDDVRLVLTADRLTVRSLTVTASGDAARQRWALSEGYDDASGDVLVEVQLTERSDPVPAFPAPPAGDAVDGGFVDAPAASTVAGPDLPAPTWLPPGFTDHRAGTQGDVTVQTWSDGRAWISVRATRTWEGGRLFGDVDSLVRAVAVGEGVGYVDAGGDHVAVHGDGVDVEVAGSASTADLLAVAASLPVEGIAMPTGWAQAATVDQLPDGALRPPGELVARVDGGTVTVAVPGPGDAAAVLVQEPGTRLDPPADPDVAAVAVRGVTARYAPSRGTLSWVEDGWRRELRSIGLDLTGLLAVAEELEPA